LRTTDLKVQGRRLDAQPPVGKRIEIGAQNTHAGGINSEKRLVRFGDYGVRELLGDKRVDLVLGEVIEWVDRVRSLVWSERLSKLSVSADCIK
jgi:hypothetical protein